jgi:hypothetical protein
MSTFNLNDDHTMVVTTENRSFSISSDKGATCLYGQLYPGVALVWDLPDYEETLDEYIAILQCNTAK